jgi:2-polyprenyl-3-methyl-5-hydroxy-6-metoxy-1,4-benzoquinol methylase
MNMYDKLWSKDWKNVQTIGPLTHTRYRLMLEQVPKNLHQDPRVIDVGCGNGTFLEMLRKRYPNGVFHGVEYSSQAKLEAPEHLQKNIQVGDIVELAPLLSENPYDLVICSEVLEHVVEPHKAMQAIASLLRNGGTAILTVPCGMKYWSKQDEVAGHLRRFEYKEFANLVEESRLKIEEQYAWGGPFSLTYDRLVDFVGPEQVIKIAA